MNENSAALLPKIDIRLADYNSIPDGQAIIGLLDHYARQVEGGGKPLPATTVTNLIGELDKLDGAISVLAFENGKAVGLINCLQTFSTFKCRPVLNIHDVIVREDFRQRGIAQAMFSLVKSHAKEKGCCKLSLEVLSKNEAAMALYKKLGFDAYELHPKMGQALFWEKVI